MTDLTAKKIRDKCREDIKKLQKICNHPGSTWMGEEWAPGHGTGRQVKVCDVCEKVLEAR